MAFDPRAYFQALAGGPTVPAGFSPQEYLNSLTGRNAQMAGTIHGAAQQADPSGRILAKVTDLNGNPLMNAHDGSSSSMNGQPLSTPAQYRAPTYNFAGAPQGNPVGTIPLTSGVPATTSNGTALPPMTSPGDYRAPKYDFGGVDTNSPFYRAPPPPAPTAPPSPDPATDPEGNLRARDSGGDGDGSAGSGAGGGSGSGSGSGSAGAGSGSSTASNDSGHTGGNPQSVETSNYGSLAGLGGSLVGGLTGTMGLGTVAGLAGTYADLNNVNSTLAENGFAPLGLDGYASAAVNNATSTPFGSIAGTSLADQAATEMFGSGPVAGSPTAVQGSWGPTEDQDEDVTAGYTMSSFDENPDEDTASTTSENNGEDGQGGTSGASGAGTAGSTGDNDANGDGGDTGDSGDSGDGGDGGGGDGGGDGDAKGGLIGKRRVFSGMLKGPGTPTSDSIPTNLVTGGHGPNVSRGEFVLNAATTNQMTPATLRELQRQTAAHPNVRVTPADIRRIFSSATGGAPRAAR